MPSTPRKKTKGYYIELPPELVEKFDRLSEKTGRTRTLEIVRAMRRHLAYPELDLPPVGPLPESAVPPDGDGTQPVEVQVESASQPAPAKLRGRPRKGSADQPGEPAEAAQRSESASGAKRESGKSKRK